MYFKQFYDNDLAQGAYLIGCQATGEAVVVDAHRDIQMILDDAEANNLKIVAVLETHMHADYLSAVPELAAATGAQIYLSDEGDKDWKYEYEGIKLYDGDEIKIGNIIITAQHTPGHTLEHLSYLVTDGAFADKPGYYLTGDFVFVGDIGRPDLLDEAAGAIDTRYAGAKLMFKSLKEKFLNLPDYIQVWPGHGAGSACGKALGAIPCTTVGYERNFSWWAEYIKNDDYKGFEEALLSGQPDAPMYFARMKIQNKAGAAILGELPELKEFSASEIKPKIAKDIIFIDTRDDETFRNDGVKDAYGVPWGKKFVTYTSWLIDSLNDKRDIVVLAKNAQEADAMRRRLIRVGIDNVIGFVSDISELDRFKVETIKPQELNNTDDYFVLDVRTANDYNEGHLDNATQIHGSRIMWNLDKLPRDKKILSYCQKGLTNTIASSALRSAGFKDIVELEGGYSAWLDAKRQPALAN